VTVERVERGELGDRDQVTAAEPADLALHAALLVRAGDAGRAEERVEPVMRPQRDEPFVLDAVAAHQDPHDRGLEVVVAHQPGRHATEVGERQRVALEERLLRLMRERDREPPPRRRQPHHEQLQHHQLPRDPSAELPEVDFRVRARRVLLADRDIDRDVVQLSAHLGHERADRRLGHIRAVLGHQPLPHPTGRMPLLARHHQIGFQPAADQPLERPQRRRRPISGLARRRRRGRDRLTHRPSMHPIPLSQPTNADPFIAMISADTFVQLHPRLLHTPSSREPWSVHAP
jgi:hypothetical protein